MTTVAPRVDDDQCGEALHSVPIVGDVWRMEVPKAEVRWA